MGTVTIGGRELQVKTATLGLLKRRLMPARKALAGAEEDDVPDRIAEVVLCYVDGNEGVDKEWLLDALPADPSSVMRELIVASGQKVGEPKPGEGARQ